MPVRFLEIHAATAMSVVYLHWATLPQARVTGGMFVRPHWRTTQCRRDIGRPLSCTHSPTTRPCPKVSFLRQQRMGSWGANIPP